MIPESLTRYLENWSLSSPHLLARTATSHIYTVVSGGETVILKLISPNGVEERNGAVALRCFNGQGAVRLLRADDNAHLLEYADGDDLTGIVKNGGDEEATGIIADTLKQLHSAYTGAPPQGLRPLDSWFRSLFTAAERDASAGNDSLYVRGARVARHLLDHPRQPTVLHGDIHHENFRYKVGRGWLAFDPKGLYGERTYDTANTFCNPLNMPALVDNEARVLRTAEIFSARLDIEPSRILAFVFAYACLSASWTLAEGDERGANETLRIAQIVEPHLYLP